jgi:prevent-host-death family protein
MSFIDRRVPPAAAINAGTTLAALLAFAARCVECPPLGESEFWALRRAVPRGDCAGPMHPGQTELGVQDARNTLRTVVDDALIRRKPTIISRHGERVAAVVPYAWFEEMIKARGEDHDDSTSRSSE